MLLSYKIEYHKNSNQSRVNLLNHCVSQIGIVNNSFYIYYVYSPENDCFIQDINPFMYHFYTNDKELLATLNRNVNLFAKHIKFSIETEEEED